MEDLSKLRQDIDRIDRQIVELFEERMGVSRQVAEYKIANGKKVLDRARELEKLETLGNLTDDSFNRHGIQELFQQIMAMSRKLQYQLLAEEGVSGQTFHLQELTILTESTVVWCIRVWKVLMHMKQPCSILAKMPMRFMFRPGGTVWKLLRKVWQIMLCFLLKIHQQEKSMISMICWKNMTITLWENRS